MCKGANSMGQTPALVRGDYVQVSDYVSLDAAAAIRDKPLRPFLAVEYSSRVVAGIDAVTGYLRIDAVSRHLVLGSIKPQEFSRARHQVPHRRSLANGDATRRQNPHPSRARHFRVSRIQRNSGSREICAGPDRQLV